MRRKTPRFVPSLVFTSAIAGVIPACGGVENDRRGGIGSGGALASGGSAGTGSGGRFVGSGGHVMALAVGGFSFGGWIALAIAGFTGAGGRPVSTGGRFGYGGNIVVLAIAGFTGSGGSGGGVGTGGTHHSLDAGPNDAAPDGPPVIILAMMGFQGRPQGEH